MRCNFRLSPIPFVPLWASAKAVDLGCLGDDKLKDCHTPAIVTTHGDSFVCPPRAPLFVRSALRIFACCEEIAERGS
ncbi:hypothetical protein DFH94DRAFT_762542 [Russula ochroleuca]|uniref:Uncharacterized protein n=1 Tax=Russula ochroleuca TaxID=152965 RepID=A0A9P5MRD6_9AGAM|nr:hypothetical protein DFH94DRAFT_762542 [Russula ochroleuca]